MLAFLLLLSGGALAAASLPESIAAVATDSPDVARGHWGARIVLLPAGPDSNPQVVFEHQPDHWFTPASNTKLFTTALALTRLGPNHRFETTVLAPPPDSSGAIPGDLILRGGGDPTLSGRPYPYVNNAVHADPLTPLRELAAQLAARGIRRIRGRIIGDDSAFAWQPYPDAWTIGDALWEYGAPVSALTLNDNFVTVRVEAGQSPRQPVRISLTPALDYLPLLTRIRTLPRKQRRKLEVERDPATGEITISGGLPARSTAELELAVSDPAHFTAFAFREVLKEAGIAVEGGIAARHRRPGSPAEPYRKLVPLATRQSPPLSGIIQTVNKVSQNLEAEMLLRAVARHTGAAPTLKTGIDEMKKFLTAVGVPKDAYHFDDGSGLARRTLVTPRAVSTLLEAMDRGAHREAWLASLPVGGVDGTLDKRFRQLPEGVSVHAKTGTLSHVSALGGYAHSRTGRRYAFSILVNHTNTSSAVARAFIDRIVEQVLNEP